MAQTRPESAQAWYLGIDLGTGSCKCTAVGTDESPLALGAGRYPAGRYEDSGEQDPELLWSGLVQAVQEAVRALDGKACGGISLGGTLHGLLAVDRTGNALGGALNWADSRPLKVVRRLRAEGRTAGLYARTSCPPHWLYPLFKLAWMRREQPERFKATAWFLNLKDYFLQRLSGEQPPYRTDWTSAGGSGLLDLRALRWDEAGLELAGVRPAHLPVPGGPLENVGRLCKKAAGALGLPSGIPLVLGSADAANSSLGAGTLQPGELTCMIGTSGALRTFLDEPPQDPEERVWCYPVDRGLYLAGGAINNGGLALTWLKDLFRSAGADLSFDRLLEMAAGADRGAGGVLCLPFFSGERSPNWSLDASGVFIGLRTDHQAAQLARAVVEGVAFRLRSVQDLLEQVGVPVYAVRASGGFAHSNFWLQLVADTLGQPLVVPAWEETSSLGAAWWPLLAARPELSLARLTQSVAIRETVVPDGEARADYQRLYAGYQRLYALMRPLFNAG